MSGEESYDISVSGSVGDGPVVSALLNVTSKSGEFLTNAIGDQLAGYDLEVKTKGKHYPLTIDASGGVDLVTGLPLDFTMRTSVPAPRSNVVANLNPFTTLAMATASQMTGGLSAQNVTAALGMVVTEFNMGMTSAVSRDPMTVVVDDSNLAEMIKSSEGLAEIFRRVSRVLSNGGFSVSIQSVIDAIGADLVDGSLDGRGGSGVDRRISATAKLVAAQVAIEAMRNEIRVNDQIATPTLDDIVRSLADGQNPDLTDSRPVTSYLIGLAQDGVEAATALGGSSALDALQTALDGLQPGASAASARQTLSSSATTTMSASIQQVASGSDADVDLVLATSSEPVNTPPTISGTPATSVMVNTSYGFTPTAMDADADPLTFSILGRPSWASFSQTTGALTGTPPNTGTYSNIRISVSDGQASASLAAFSITVTAAPPPPPPPNTPPTIGGSPSPTALQDTPYSFTPTADDADGDPLTFFIVNQPIWANFSPTTGQLSGTPSAGNVGPYDNIQISVSDGEASANLPAFSITVEAIALGSATLSWTAPTQNEDGSPLTDLAGYRVRWGQVSGGGYPNSQTIMNPGITTYVVDNLPSGTHYFVVTAINAADIESDFSNEASKTIP